MDRKHVCRHYTDLTNLDANCGAGVKYRDIAAKCAGRIVALPCFNASEHSQCPLYEPHTDEELAAQKAAINATIARFNDFEVRKTDACPHCGTTIVSLQQVGRCVYGSCGCRIWQGTIPPAWKDAEQKGSR